jgi:hypothetical protein
MDARENAALCAAVTDAGIETSFGSPREREKTGACAPDAQVSEAVTADLDARPTR